MIRASRKNCSRLGHLREMQVHQRFRGTARPSEHILQGRQFGAVQGRHNRKRDPFLN
jgi:hypothetical protein